MSNKHQLFTEEMAPARLGQPWAFSKPRLRKEWDSLDEQSGISMTQSEMLWLVIITMNIAGMRDEIFERWGSAPGAMQEYLMHFFVTWNVLWSPTTYSARFNDNDLFHSLLWGAYTIGLMLLTAHLYVDLQGYATVAATLSLILATAYARIAVCLPCACIYAAYQAVTLVVLATFLLSLSCTEERGALERAALWVIGLAEPVAATVWKVGVFISGSQTKLDVPGDFSYIYQRCNGMHNMYLVVSFLFPLGLQGARFSASAEAASVVLLGLVFGVILKLTLLDVPEINPDPTCADSRRHPMRRGWVHSRCFFFALPGSLLGVALTGLGFVGAVIEAAGGGPGEDLVHECLSAGPALLVAMQGVIHALHAPRGDQAAAHRSRIALAACSAFLFVLPYLQRWPPLPLPLLASFPPLGIFGHCAYDLLVQLLLLGASVKLSAAGHNATPHPGTGTPHPGRHATAISGRHAISHVHPLPPLVATRWFR